jgi:hypothetical protein
MHVDVLLLLYPSNSSSSPKRTREKRNEYNDGSMEEEI